MQRAKKSQYNQAKLWYLSTGLHCLSYCSEPQAVAGHFIASITMDTAQPRAQKSSSVKYAATVEC